MSTVYLITLPIGNIDDLTPRARKLLESDGLFLAEDTRKFFDFLQRASITRSNRQVFAFHDHTQGENLDFWMQKLEHGENLYLVSDAGSPIISDPAFPLVRKAVELGHAIDTCPGVSAVTTALELSALPPHPFYFYGFLAREKEKRRSAFSDCQRLKGTHIFFESPQRIEDALADLAVVAPEVSVAVARELTKTYQEVYRFEAKEFPTIRSKITYKGEFVLLFHVAQVSEQLLSTKAKELVAEYLSGKGSPKLLAKIFAEVTGESNKDIYQRLAIKKESSEEPR